MSRLAGKRVVITGAGSGIGRASVHRFVEEGAEVVAVDLNEEGLQETKELTSDQSKVHIITADAGDEVAVEQYVKFAIEQLGGIDVLYANAGITGSFSPLLEQTAEEWQTVLRVNLIGPFLAIKHVAPQLIKQGTGGSIICTASTAGIRSGAGPAHYSASKAGVINLVQIAANDFLGTNIRVNAVCPGLIETGMTKIIFDFAKAKGTDHKIGQLNPLQRTGDPMEIANAVLFLASDESSYVNGQALPVCGGLSSSHPVSGRSKK